jgi:mono/diheme cytochrome c family protein
MKRVEAVFAVGIVLSLTIGTRAAAAQTPEAAAVYRQHCKTCHGATGTPTQRMVGLYPKLKTLADSTLMAGLSVDSIVNLIRTGRGDMKPLGGKLTADQMTAVAQYVKGIPAAAHKP